MLLSVYTISRSIFFRIKKIILRIVFRLLSLNCVSGIVYPNLAIKCKESDCTRLCICPPYLILSDQNSLHNLTFYASSFKYLSQRQLCDNLCRCSGCHTQESPMIVWSSAVTVLNEIMPLIATWMDIKISTPSEVR